jgi:hypothetical protein
MAQADPMNPGHFPNPGKISALMILCAANDSPQASFVPGKLNPLGKRLGADAALTADTPAESFICPPQYGIVATSRYF